MTSVKISALTAAGALDGGEVVPVVQDGVTVKAQVSDFVTYATTSGVSQTVETLAALKALTSRPESVLVKGKLTANDGWGGVFVWVAGSSTTADDALVVQCTSGTAGRYKRISSPTYAERDITASGAASAANYASFLSGTVDGSTSDFAWAYSYINVAESIDNSSAALGAAVSGLYVNHAGNEGSATRMGIWSVYSHDAATTTPTSRAFYTGVFATVAVNSDDGGTGGSPKGNFYGFGSIVTATSAATNLQGVIGAEFDVACDSGSSMSEKVILQLITVNSDAEKGSDIDAGLLIAGDSTTTAQLDFGIAFGKTGSKWNVSGTLIGAYTTTNAMEVVNGVDFSAVTFSGNAFKSTGFTVGPTGAVAGASLAATGAITGGSKATLTNAFGAFEALQSAGGTGFRWTLVDDGTWLMQRTTDGFSGATTVLTIGTDVSATFADFVQATSFKVSGNQVVGARNTGWTAMTGTPDESTVYDTASVTLPQLAGRVAALQAALTTHGLIGA